VSSNSKHERRLLAGGPTPTDAEELALTPTRTPPLASRREPRPTPRPACIARRRRRRRSAQIRLCLPRQLPAEAARPRSSFRPKSPVPDVAAYLGFCSVAHAAVSPGLPLFARSGSHAEVIASWSSHTSAWHPLAGFLPHVLDRLRRQKEDSSGPTSPVVGRHRIAPTAAPARKRPGRVARARAISDQGRASDWPSKCPA
jgi:hypothetical protein